MAQAKKEFKPTTAMVEAAYNVFTAMAVVATVRPIVERYQTAILAEGQWRVRPDYATKRRAAPGDPENIEPEVILDPKLSYLMSDEDFAVYDTCCKRARDIAGLHVTKDDFCPLLVSEHTLIKAEQGLIDAMAETTRITKDRILGVGMDKYKEYIDLTLRLLAPFVDERKKEIAVGRRFIKCEESSVGILAGLGIQAGEYDHGRGGVEATVNAKGLENLAGFSADFQVEDVPVQDRPHLLLDGALAAPGETVRHKEYGEVKLDYSEDKGWHYLRLGHAGFGKDLENLSTMDVQLKNKKPSTVPSPGM